MSPISYDTSHYQKFTPPFDIPDSWEWVRLEDIANIGTGATPSRGNKKYYGGNINWVSSSVTSKRYVYEPTDHITDLAIKETNCVIYPIGTLIMAMYGEGKTRGQLTELKIEAATNQACAAVQPLNIETKEFIKLYLLANYYHLRQLAEGGNQPNLNIGKICGLYLPFPPLKEQSRIVNEYSKFDKVINSIDNNQCVLLDIIANTKSKILELAMQGKLVPQDPTDETDEAAAEMLKRINPKARIITDNPHSWNIPSNWAWISVKDVFKPMERKLPSGNQFLYIDIDSIDNKNNTVIPKTISVKTAPSRASRKTIKGDIVFSMVRPYLKNIATVPEDDCIASTGFYVLSCTASIDPQFAFQIAISDFFVQGLNSYMKGDNSPSINKDNIENYVIPLPPMKEQKRIVAKIEEIFSCLDEIEASLQS